MIQDENIRAEPSSGPLSMLHFPWGCVPAGLQPKGPQAWRREGSIGGTKARELGAEAPAQSPRSCLLTSVSLTVAPTVHRRVGALKALRDVEPAGGRL